LNFRFSRRLRVALAVVLAAVLPASAGLAIAPAPDWGYLRRHGDAALFAVLRNQLAPQPWRATYQETRLPTGHPFAGLRLTVARMPGPKLGGALFLFEDPPCLRGIGVVTLEGNAWVHLPGRPVEPATPALLGMALPLLGVPLIVLAGTETEDLFTRELVGDFGEISIFQLDPVYEKGPGLQRMKMAIQKRTITLDALQVVDRQSALVAGAQWQRIELQQGMWSARRLTLRPITGDAATFDLDRTQLLVGQDAERLRFDASALQ